MTSLSDISRLNVLIELFSECADAADLDALIRIVSGRIGWVLDFNRCAFVLVRRGERACWSGGPGDETLRPVALADLPEAEATLVDRVLERGTPAALSPGRICVPIQAVGNTMGALCFSREAGAYTHRDMRLAHHAGHYLGSLVARMDLEDEARRLSARKDEILALLSHELRNPLAPIITAVHLLKVQQGSSPSKALDVIERQAQHLVRLVDDLLDVARLTRGQVVLQRKPVEIAQVVARGVEIAAPLIEQRRHALATDVPSAGLGIDGDENRLAQVVGNLLSNAARYTPVAGHIGIAARRDGDAVVIEVSDDGVGISPEAMSDIFDLFVRGSDRPSEDGGLGLGLVVAKQLTELHGGTISAASAGEGCGTKFTVRLPARAGLIPSAVCEPASPVPRADVPRRVLLVDDNEDAIDLLSTLLESAGHEVATARDGLEALAVVDRFRPMVAVIDLAMPVMDGYELASRLGAQLGENQPYLVALTGYGQTTDRERSSAAGFHEHLVKPVDLTRLLGAIARSPAPTPLRAAAEPRRTSSM